MARHTDELDASAGPGGWEASAWTVDSRCLQGRLEHANACSQSASTVRLKRAVSQIRFEARCSRQGVTCTGFSERTRGSGLDKLLHLLGGAVLGTTSGIGRGMGLCLGLAVMLLWEAAQAASGSGDPEWADLLAGLLGYLLTSLVTMCEPSSTPAMRPIPAIHPAAGRPGIVSTWHEMPQELRQGSGSPAPPFIDGVSLPSTPGRRFPDNLTPIRDRLDPMESRDG